MQTNSPFNFVYSYLLLPEKFYSLEKPSGFTSPSVFLLNKKLCEQLNIITENQQELIDAFLAQGIGQEKSFAQAYAGHQFGGFNKLGDGRAIVLGEHITQTKLLFDIQLKGSGRTLYSRGGDGKATLKAMLREYLISEAMFHLNIPSSRTIAVLKTGEPVFRETIQEAAAIIRVMKSHIRVGTFEYAARFGTAEDIIALTNYTIKRLYPELIHDVNPALSLLHKVMEQQINLVANWLRVGFIHGVMNTDNSAISGETFDYGPCAFMNGYHNGTVYSSIDVQGRYAFGNQYRIIKWNIARFAEALIPILHNDAEKAIALAQDAIDSFDTIWQKTYYGLMLKKIGIATYTLKHHSLIDELLELMQKLNMDYTNTFWDLSQENLTPDNPINNEAFATWLNKWKEVIGSKAAMQNVYTLMQQNNPFVIPRNHVVEQALDEATTGNMELFNKLLQALATPYQQQDNISEFTTRSTLNFERGYQTFCGT